MLTHRQLADHVNAILDGALREDAAAVADRLATIADQGTAQPLWLACCGFATVSARVIDRYGHHCTTPSDHEHHWGVQPDTASTPAELFAVRFVTVWLNDDRETAGALFKAAIEDPDDPDGDAMVECIWALIGLTAQLLRDPERFFGAPGQVDG